MIAVSIPSKVHLLGEHAVVYGKPALLAAIDKRIVVTITPSKIKKIQGIGKHVEEIKQLLEILEREIKKRTKLKKIKPYSITISSEVPVGSGLGSSAALSAGLTASLLLFLEIPWDNKIIFDIAYSGEKFFHGNPSGGDLATVIGGGFLLFRKNLKSSKTFSTLPLNLNKNIKKFILVDSGKPKESTKEMVEKVLKLKLSSSTTVKNLFDSQEKLTKKMAIALENGDEDGLMRCIKLGEKNLERLGVVGEKAQAVIRSIEKLGGVAKITGAGGIKEGSGMLLVYHKKPIDLRSIVLLRGLQYSKIALGENGLRQE